MMSLEEEIFMFIDLSEVMSVKDKTLTVSAEIEADSFHTASATYKYVGPKEADLTFVNSGKRKALLTGIIKATLSIPCDRCLEPVLVDFSIDVCKEIDMSGQADRDTMDEMSKYVSEDSMFDTEEFVYNEILVNLPMKVLCKEDCKGICNRCGANLNKESCDCNTKELDPRMAKVLEVFNQFKEV